MKICSQVESIKNLIIKARRDIHSCPELSGEEYKTTDYICSFLSERKIKFKRFETGVIADFSGLDKSKRIALRCDIDALLIEEKNDVSYKSTNGNMHACGHDGHTAIMLGMCHLLSITRPKCNVRIIFQPAEEGKGGAEGMIDNGAVENVDEIYAIHVSPNYPVGTLATSQGALFAGTIEFYVEFDGVASHCAEPQKGSDAIKALTSYVCNSENFIEKYKSNTLFHTGKIDGGTARNIVAAHSIAYSTLRFFDEAHSDAIMMNVANFLSKTDKLLKTKHRLVVEAVYPPLINSGVLAKKIAHICDNCIECEPAYTAEDFAFYCQKIPACMVWLGVRDDKHCSPLHSSTFDFDENALLYGAEMFYRLVF